MQNTNQKLKLIIINNGNKSSELVSFLPEESDEVVVAECAYRPHGVCDAPLAPPTPRPALRGGEGGRHTTCEERRERRAMIMIAKNKLSRQTKNETKS